jgi:hypothetical protein
MPEMRGKNLLMPVGDEVEVVVPEEREAETRKSQVPATIRAQATKTASAFRWSRVR